MNYSNGLAIPVLIFSLSVASCSQKKPTTQAATETLQKSFQNSDPSVTKEIVEANAAFRAANYTQAMLLLNHAVGDKPVDAAQKKAIDGLIHQTRQAIQQDPKLDSPDLYNAISQLVTRVHGEN